METTGANYGYVFIRKIKIAINYNWNFSIHECNNMQKLITAEEHEKIRQVVEKAEALEKSEEERLGYVYKQYYYF